MILIGSLLAKKPWSKPMMSARGFILPILFPCGLFIGLSLAGSYVGVNLPLTGESTLRYAIPYGELNIATETPVTAVLTEEYWIALTAGAFSVVAKVLQGKIVSGAGHTVVDRLHARGGSSKADRGSGEGD
jgi:hypothetical protein